MSVSAGAALQVCVAALCVQAGCTASQASSTELYMIYYTPPVSNRVVTVPAIEAAYQSLFTYRDIDGAPLTRQPDARAIVVVVFATWCQPCRNQIGWLGEILRHEPRLQVIGVNQFDETGFSGDEQVRAYRLRNAPWMRVVRADPPLLEGLGHPRYVPSVYLFDSLGRLVQAYIPPMRSVPGKDELEARIREILSDA